MARALIGFILGAFLAKNFSGPPSPPFYLIESDHGIECAMERHFPLDRVVYCSEQAQQVLSLVQGLNNPHPILPTHAEAQ